MIDKSNESSNNEAQSEHDEDLSKLTEEFEFDDDLDIDQDGALGDSHGLGDDELLIMDDDEFSGDDSFQEDFDTNAVQSSGGSMDFIKTYGIVILIALVFGYYAFSSITSMFLGGKTAPPKVVSSAEKPAQIIPETTIKQESKPQEVIKDKVSGLQDLDLTSELAAEVTDNKDSNDINSIGDYKDLAEQAVTSDIVEQPLNLDVNGIKSLSTQPKVALNSDGSAADFRDSENAALAAKINELLDSVESLNKKIDQKSAKNSGNVDSVKKLLSNVNTKMVEVADYVQSAGKAIGLLSKQVKHQELVLTSIVGSTVNIAGVTKVNANSSVGSTIGGDLSGLTVEAVTSGRAWLKTSKGQALVVGVGDDIPGYGKVVKISTSKSTVTTDKGKVIK